MFVAVLFLVPSAMGFSEAQADDPAELQLDKPCVVVGRILGTDVRLYPAEPASETGERLPDMCRIKGFEILNLTTGQWQPLTLSKEGYFCANIAMGQYDLRGRDCQGRPYLIHHFNVPLNMAVNLGTFQLETCDPNVAARERWHNYFRTAGWKVYREGEGQIAVRLKHDIRPKAYDDCRKWFADCHKEVFEHYESVMARR